MKSIPDILEVSQKFEWIAIYVDYTNIHFVNLREWSGNICTDQAKDSITIRKI